MNDFQMAPAETGQAMNQLTAAGTDLTNGWTGASAAISAAVGQLGKGVLGQAFLQGYQGHADQVTAAAGTCTRIPGQLADTGNQCVAIYVDTEDTNAGAYS
jgi:hypothetical protein